MIIPPEEARLREAARALLAQALELGRDVEEDMETVSQGWYLWAQRAGSLWAAGAMLKAAGDMAMAVSHKQGEKAGR